MWGLSRVHNFVDHNALACRLTTKRMVWQELDEMESTNCVRNVLRTGWKNDHNRQAYHYLNILSIAKHGYYFVHQGLS
jgi:hypothetical protein